MHVCRCHSQVCSSILNKYAAIVDPYPLECPFLYPLDARSCIRWTPVLVSVGRPFLYPLDACSCICCTSPVLVSIGMPVLVSIRHLFLYLLDHGFRIHAYGRWQKRVTYNTYC